MAFTTRKSLLARVREGGEIPWGEFYATYKPLIMLCGGDCGLSPEEKEELVQRVMCEIFQKDIVGKYDPDRVPDHVVFKHDPARGRFCHYLRKIIRYQALHIIRDRKKNGRISGKTGISGLNPDRFRATLFDCFPGGLSRVPASDSHTSSTTPYHTGHDL